MSIFEPIPLVAADLSIPEYARCQEASIFSRESYIPCGAPASTIVDNGDSRPYYMCDACANHNIHNRRGKLLAKNSRSQLAG